jgi:hypothetical protein
MSLIAIWKDDTTETDGWTEEPNMQNPVEIENIEALRHREGIEDVELREEIRRLEVGDLVNLTLLTGAKAFAGETLSVRITQVKEGAFSGKLTTPPAFLGLSKLRVGSSLRFTTAHIHSIPRRQLKHEP